MITTMMNKKRGHIFSKLPNDGDPSAANNLLKRGAKEKVQAGKDQEKAQSEKDSHSKNRGGKKTNKLTIRYLYHETYRKPNEQLFSQ